MIERIFIVTVGFALVLAGVHYAQPLHEMVGWLAAPFTIVFGIMMVGRAVL
jgi:hypothetical protein